MPTHSPADAVEPDASAGHYAPGVDPRVRVGVIGAGSIGTTHALNLAGRVSGSVVTVVVDPEPQRAAHLAQLVGARSADSPSELIGASDVDAVLIASPDDVHAEQALAVLGSGLPVLVEKPLAPGLDDALAVMAAEVAGGRRLVTVGFMRRFDPGFERLKAQLDGGLVGEPLLVHCCHRNVRAAYGLRSDRTMTNMVIHDIDTARWLLGDDIASVQVIRPRPAPDTPAGQCDPLLVLLRTTRDVVVSVEAFAQATYGYEVTCHVTAARGLLDLVGTSDPTRTQAGRRGHDIPEDWTERFADAYRRELQAWIDSVHGRTSPSGASAWDGVAATATAAAAVRALTAPGWVSVDLPARPALYG